MSIKSAIRKGDTAALKEIIAAGADVNERYVGDNSTPLHYAAEKDQAESAKLLIEAGADVNATERENQGARIPLHNAALYGSPGVAGVLLEHGAACDPEESFTRSTPLHYCTDREGHPDVMEVLLSHGASIDKPDKHGNTALHRAAAKGHMDLVLLLLSRGAAPNPRDYRGETPLDRADENGHEAMAQALVSVGGKRKRELPDPKLKRPRAEAAAEEPANRGEETPSGSCFIATAACGGPGAVDVVRLQEFRDVILRPTYLGRATVRGYERVSPPLARAIARSRSIRAAVRLLVVKPCRLMAELLLLLCCRAGCDRESEAPTGRTRQTDASEEAR